MDGPLRISSDGREITALVRPLATGHRAILGIAGPPGAGKSTLAEAVARQVPGAVVVPMDGFHLADSELARRGLLDCKGAPETFDAWGYAALLRRLRECPGHDVLAPGFERTLEQPVAAAICVPPEATLIVTEGNYLLLDRPEWGAVRQHLDQVWQVWTDEKVRRQRLIARHVEFGKPLDEATAWVARVDEPNARLVDAQAPRADVRLDLSLWRPAGAAAGVPVTSEASGCRRRPGSSRRSGRSS